MKLLVIVPNYPSNNSAAYQFVHDRVLEYHKSMSVDVFCYNSKFEKKYNHEGIAVFGGGEKELVKTIKTNNYDCFAFHFLNIKNALFILKYLREKKVFIWFHGSDCISWRRRLPSINYKKEKLTNIRVLSKLMAFIIYNKNRLFYIRRLNQKCNNITFIFVSKWLLNASEKDINIQYKNCAVIPNYIKLDKFKYQAKNEQQRLNVLSINNYANNIYGGDMIRDIILKFSTRQEFNFFHFNIYGYGTLFDLYTKEIEFFDNVSIHKGTLTPDQIASIHRENGVFLYPKRGDSQGVSRCEAMSSGLVPIASKVEAVSEFSPESTAYLTKSIDDFVEALVRVYYNPEEFIDKSKKSSQIINDKCSYQKTIRKEIDLLSDL